MCKQVCIGLACLPGVDPGVSDGRANSVVGKGEGVAEAFAMV